MRRYRIALSLAILTGFAGRAHAQLGIGPGYNALFFESLVASNTETNGRLAVGGNANLANYGVGTDASVANGQYSLVVGGTLTGANVGVNHGNVYANAKTGTIHTNAPGATITTGGTPPLDFAALAQTYTTLSSTLGALSSTTGSAVANRYGTWTFSAGNAGLNVFNVDASTFGGACTVNVSDLAAGATAVINVHGATAQTTNCGMFVNGSAVNGNNTSALASRILWNYVDATDLIFRGSILGSILAPNATVVAGYSQLVGDIVAKSAVSNMEFYARPFEGDLPRGTVTPEPVTMTLLGSGLAGLAAVRRRRTKRED